MPKKASIEKIDPQLMADVRMSIMVLRGFHDEEKVIDALKAYIAEYELAMSASGMLIGEWPPVEPDWAKYWEQAWQMWPVAGKRRSSKSGAKGHFHEQSRKIGPEALLTAISRYVLSPDVEKDDGAYTPAMDRWLRQKKWEVWLEDVAVKRVGFV